MTKRVQIYVDESGHASQGEVFAMAGLGGVDSQWLGLADDWTAVMKGAGLSEPFHAGDFEGLRDQFEKFRSDRHKAVELHRKLTGIMSPIAAKIRTHLRPRRSSLRSQSRVS